MRRKAEAAPTRAYLAADDRDNHFPSSAEMTDLAASGHRPTVAAADLVAGKSRTVAAYKDPAAALVGKRWPWMVFAVESDDARPRKPFADSDRVMVELRHLRVLSVCGPEAFFGPGAGNVVRLLDAIATLPVETLRAWADLDEAVEKFSAEMTYLDIDPDVEQRIDSVLATVRLHSRLRRALRECRDSFTVNNYASTAAGALRDVVADRLGVDRIGRVTSGSATRGYRTLPVVSDLTSALVLAAASDAHATLAADVFDHWKMAQPV